MALLISSGLVFVCTYLSLMLPEQQYKNNHSIDHRNSVVCFVNASIHRNDVKLSVALFSVKGLSATN